MASFLWSSLIELPATFTANSLYRPVAIVGLVFFSAMGIASVWTAAVNPDNSFPNPVLAAILFALLYGAFFLLGMYLLLFSSRYELIVDNDTISQTGVFTQKSTAISNIQSARWRNWPNGGSLRLHSIGTRISIEFQAVEREDRDKLIQYLRSAVAAEKQTNWDSFFLNPDNITQQQSSSPIRHGSAAVIFYAQALVFVGLWVWGLGAKHLPIAALNAGFATYMVYGKSKDNS